MAFVSYGIYIKKSLNSYAIDNYLPLKATINILENIINRYQSDEQIISHNLRGICSKFAPSEQAIALFPLIIYCYQSPHKLEQELDKIIELQPLKNRDINSIKILSVIIYLILEEKIDFSNITEQISQELALENAQEIKEIQLIEKLINHL